MLRNRLSLALAVLVVLPAAASAHENFLSRMVSPPDDAGRWANRRFTIRHKGQDGPYALIPTRHEDNFVGRAFTARHDEGRWLNRRLTFRHEGQDAR